MSGASDREPDGARGDADAKPPAKRPPGKREQRALATRRALLASAGTRMAESGLDALRARDVASDAGVALGTIYKYFSDFDELILRINSQTLERLSAALGEAAAGVEDPRERLVRLALAYLAFAEREPRLWAALFAHRMAGGAPVPEWHLRDHEALFALIAEPVAALAPHLDAAGRAVRTRTVFAAVHGVVALALEDRFIGVPRGALEREVEEVARGLIATLEAQAGGA